MFLICFNINRYCYSNYQQSNKDIVDSDKLIEFLSYGKNMVKLDSKESIDENKSYIFYSWNNL